MSTRVGSERAASARPTGTVTFLFSDIESSTPRWEKNSDAMASALARHDAIMRTEIEKNGGYVFKTVGDAFCAAFTRTSDAVSAAAGAQRELEAEDFSAVDGIHVRIAVHAGSANERDGDYFGPAVNRVARLLGIGYGGQTLLSQVSYELANVELQTRYEFRDLGEHALEGIAKPEHVYQLVIPGLPDAFPPLRSLGSPASNLPAQLTSFVGREEAIAEIEELVRQHRLVTLAGTGGVGKTRCAVRTGEQLLDSFDDGVWFVELAAIAEGSLMAHAAAQTFNLRESANRPMVETLAGYLKHKRVLLILDNCEHVLDEARHVATKLLGDCPDVRILATSRETLGVAGEEVYRVSSLDVNDAVKLFADRATSVEKSFKLTERNAPFIADICRRLDGIPLALELAAARVTILSPEQLARRLDERFRVLTGGARNALPRHQTMRALIDWSYELLSGAEQMLFRKLSVFAGGFTIEGATAVVRDDAIDEIEILQKLSSLVDKSLIQAEPYGMTIRYRLLESMRQYARERLVESGEYPSAAHAHALAYLELAERLNRDRDTMTDDVWSAQVEPEMENFRAALTWTLGEKGDVALGQRLASAMRNSWVRMAPAEGLKWIRAAIAATDAATPELLVARLDLAAGSLHAVVHNQKESYELIRRAVERLKSLDDPESLAAAQGRLGNLLLHLGRLTEAESVLMSALEIYERLGTCRLVSWVLNTLGLARAMQGDIDGARGFYARAVATIRDTGHEELEAEVFLDYAELEFRAGDPEAAVRLAAEARDRCQWNKFKTVAAVGLINISAYLIALDRFEEAQLHATEGLTLTRELGLPAHFAIALLHVAATAALGQTGDRASAASLLGYVDARFAAFGSGYEYTEAMERERVAGALAEALTDERFAQLLKTGSTWSEDRAVAESTAIVAATKQRLLR